MDDFRKLSSEWGRKWRKTESRQRRGQLNRAAQDEAASPAAAVIVGKHRYPLRGAPVHLDDPHFSDKSPACLTCGGDLEHRGQVVAHHGVAPAVQCINCGAEYPISEFGDVRPISGHLTPHRIS